MQGPGEIRSLLESCPLTNEIHTLLVVCLHNDKPCPHDSLLSLLQVIHHHVLLNIGKLRAATKSKEGISFELSILADFDPLKHHTLEMLDNHILLQASDASLLERPQVCLFSELSHELLIVSKLFPSLHD